MAKVSRYQEKKRQGLVPFGYNASSEHHRAGAWKNWPEKLRPEPGDGRNVERYKEEERAAIAHRESTKHQSAAHGHDFLQ
jgi:hypothetical protein